MNQNLANQEILEFSIVTTPRVAVDQCIDVGGGQIVVTLQGEVTLRAFSQDHAFQLTGILVGVMSEYDSMFRVWALHRLEEPKKHHPSEPSWA